MKPIDILKLWVKYFNSGNADELSNLYSEDAINHQVANEPIIGRENIKKMLQNELSQADMTCIIENFFEDGEWAIMEWKDPTGLRGCGFFKIQNEKIVFQRGYWDKLSFLKLNNLPIE